MLVSLPCLVRCVRGSALSSSSESESTERSPDSVGQRSSVPPSSPALWHQQELHATIPGSLGQGMGLCALRASQGTCNPPGTPRASH